MKFATRGLSDSKYQHSYAYLVQAVKLNMQGEAGAQQ